MNVIILKKSYFAFLLAGLVLFVSCSDESNLIEKQSFDYSIYNNNKTTNIDFSSGISNKSTESNTQDSFEEVLELINNEFGTNVSLNDLDEQYFKTKHAKSNETVNINSYLNETDISLIENFNKNIKSLSFDETLTNFENNVLELNLSDNEFQKYNKLANVFLLIENSFPGMLANDTEISYRLHLKSKSDCAWAIASYTLATIGLASCATGWLCPVAIAAKIIAFRNMISACGSGGGSTGDVIDTEDDPDSEENDEEEGNNNQKN